MQAWPHAMPICFVCPAQHAAPVYTLWCYASWVVLQVFLALLAKDYEWECDAQEPWITADNFRQVAAWLSHNSSDTSKSLAKLGRL